MKQHIEWYETVRNVNKGALLNAARGQVEGLLRRDMPRAKPAALDIVLTKACNLRCIFCISYGSLDKEYWMDFSLYEQVARELFPSALGVFFCSGGEPLLYPHIRKALRLARDHRTRATMTSNAMLLDAQVASWMVEDQSLQELCISFDGATKPTLERIRRGANYERILGNIERLSEMKRRRKKRYPWLWFRFAIMKSNAEELPDLVPICARLGLYKIEVKYLNVTNDIEFDESLYKHPELAERVFAEARKSAAAHGVQLVLPPLPGKGAAGRKCMKPWEFVQVDTDGSLRLCYYCWKQRLGFIEDGFDAVWRGEHYARIRRSIDSEDPYYPYCKHCAVPLGPDSESAHNRTVHEDAYAIAGLEHLQIDFNERSQENVASFQQLAEMRKRPESASTASEQKG